jgi:two-component system, NtrC family, response regulator AtoC
MALRNGIMNAGNSNNEPNIRRRLISMYPEQLHTFSFDQIIGRSHVMREMLSLARRVAESEVSCVLLQGESGTGKDCLAKAMHCASKRAGAPFVAINCAALPSNLIESELFGHEKGAFTDAKSRKEGLLEQADGGTILLDEIGELDLNLQAKLLRVLEEGSLRRVGGLKDVPFTARVIAASNRDLKNETEQGRFRLDLFYRLAVIKIDISPLRQRVLMLAEHCLNFFADRMGRSNVRGLSPEVARAFKLYDWPGNVRELRNVIERAIIVEDGDVISAGSLPEGILPGPRDCSADRSPRRERLSLINPEVLLNLPPEGISLDQLETSLLKQALARSDGNQTRAAQLLGLTRDQFRYRWKKFRESNRPRLVVAAGSRG